LINSINIIEFYIKQGYNNSNTRRQKWLISLTKNSRAKARRRSFNTKRWWRRMMKDMMGMGKMK
jgi:hypothetical protein